MDPRLRFDEDAANYDRWRPTYVPELFGDVIAYADLDDTKRALEIGIGTGQATTPFLEAGCEVVAIEPGPRLAAYTRAKFAGRRNLRVVEGDFEGLPDDGNTYDLIYSATAFHWIPQELGLSKAYALLKPGGALALFWNHPYMNRPDDPVHVAIQAVYRQYMPRDREPHEFDVTTCAQYADSLRAHGFGDIVTRIYRQTRAMGAADYIGLLNTYSDHRALDADARAGLLDGIRDAIEAQGGSITIRDTMDLYLARKP